MKITLDLPDFDASAHPGYESDGSLGTHGDCALCGDELHGVVVRLHPVGWVHADCVMEAVTSAPMAWVAVARHVAKYPSKHNASTVRAVITELIKLAESRPAPTPTPLCDCGAEIPVPQRKAYCSDRCRWDDQDHGSDDADGGDE